MARQLTRFLSVSKHNYAKQFAPQVPGLHYKQAEADCPCGKTQLPGAAL